MSAQPPANARRPMFEPPSATRPPGTGTPRPGQVDTALLATTLALVAFGIVMVYSASAVFADRTYHSAQYFLQRQALFAVLGLVGMTVASYVPMRTYRKLTYPLMGVTLLLLLFVVIGLGRSGNGAARWLRLGPFNLQPVEIAKVTTVLWIAHSLSKKQEKIRAFAVGFLPHLIVAFSLVALCMLQPDFGSSVVLLTITFAMLFLAGARFHYIALTLFLLSPLVAGAVMYSPYRRRRWLAFLDPWNYRNTIGYQLVESLMAFGAGGFTGSGLGDSRQKLLFLPEAHTDFIGAIIGEELGFLGLCGVLAAYAFLIARGMRIALRAADDYGTYVAFGISTLFSLQVLINLGVAMGALPTKGLTLPLVSYGGSALCINLVAIGIMLSISRTASGRAEG